jgi:predicted MFS family arabinose efflux permease
MAADAPESIPWKTQAAIYGAGFSNFSMVGISGLIVALLMVQITDQASVIGLVIGARHGLTFVLSIHGGVLMDRLGTRRVMIVFSCVSVVAPLLFPVSAWIPALIVLQMFAGVSDAMVWMGAQALSGRVMKGNPVYVGRMTFVVRIGSFIGPVAFGFIWDFGGIWPAFIAMSLWSLIGFICTIMIPPNPTETDQPGRTAVRPRDLVPRLSDYVSAFKLMAVPAITLVLLAAIARIGGTGIQSSFYVVYLEGINFSASTIGLLLGASGLLASLGALGAGTLARVIHPHWLIVAMVALSVVTIAVTPLLGGIFALLAAVICLRGLCLGVSQPMEISVLGRALGAGSQGKGVGLRTTVNRFASLTVPVVMGFAVDLVGIEGSFLVMGGLLFTIIVGSAIFVMKRSELGRSAEK